MDERTSSMVNLLVSDTTKKLQDIESDGLYKVERLIDTPQGGTVGVDGNSFINLFILRYTILT